MENASKALIIAGSILISILIIGVGVMIFSNVSDIFSTGTVDEQAVATYNDPFTRYGGPQKSGSQVKALCEAIRNHNLTYATDKSKLVKLEKDKDADSDAALAKVDASSLPETSATDSVTSTAHISKIKSDIKAGFTYKVTFGYDSKTGYLTAVYIKQN